MTEEPDPGPVRRAAGRGNGPPRLSSGAHIRLLGRLDLDLGRRPDGLERASARAELLLAYLLLHRAEPHPRQRLAGLFWPESTEAQARTNLRHVVHTLRAVAPEVDRYVEITTRTLRWRAEESYWLDVEEFERLLATIEPDAREDALRSAVAIYAGDLLAGFDEDWVRSERDRLRERYLVALGELAELAEARGDLAEAILLAQRLQHSDPLREESYRHLMRLHASRGDRARAVAVFHDCSATLERELGVRPAEATREAYAALLSPESTPGPARTVEARQPRLVGRAAERARLGAAWRAAEGGQARLVLVTGEPGVGKTRLVDDFRRWCARRGVVVADARCYDAEGPLAYGPVVSWLRSPALRSRLDRLDPYRRRELARLLPELLDETAGLEPPEPVPEAELRQRLFDAIASAVLQETPSAVLLVVDDLHHGDSETCQLLHYLLRVLPAARLWIVATARAEELVEEHPVQTLLAALRAADRCVELELDRLDREETAALAERLGRDALEETDLDLLYAQTEGNPLFVVEALRAGWSGQRAVTPKVQAVIESRLAQLAEPTRALAETAALIGREFGVDVLAAAADADEDVLVTGLDDLWRRRIIRERAELAYDFSHEHIRDVAAGRIAPARRRRLHLRIAEVLERGVDADPGAIAGQVAGHYQQAGAAERAASWYVRAAEARQLLHADSQAVTLIERALALLAGLPATVDRDRAELSARVSLLAPLTALRGYGAPALLETQVRAGELTARLGMEPVAALLRSQAMSAMTRGDFAAATRIGNRLLTAGEGEGIDVLVVEGAFLLGVAEFWAADFGAARQHLELAVERYRPAESRAHLIHYGNDPKVACLARLANTLWFLGEPEAALAASTDALAWADEIGHAYSRGIAVLFGALLALDMGEDDRLRDLTDELSAVHESLQLQLTAAALHGYLTVRDGAAADGVAAIRAAVERGRGHEAPGLQAILQRVLLAAYLAVDDPAAAAVADRLLEMGAGAQVWAVEAHRVRAAFLDRAG